MWFADCMVSPELLFLDLGNGAARLAFVLAVSPVQRVTAAMRASRQRPALRTC
jgi:hypothetical protein